MSVNNTAVTGSASTAIEIIGQAKNQESASPSGKSVIALCVSKTANFEHSSSSGDLCISRISEHLKLEKYLRQLPPVRPNWLERANKSDEEDLGTNLPNHPPETKKEFKRSFRRIMDDDRSVQVELIMNTSDGALGCKIEEIPSLGLYLRSINPKKQLGKALGKTGSLFGAVLFKFRGREVYTKDDINEIMEEVNTSQYSVTLGKSLGPRLSCWQL